MSTITATDVQIHDDDTATPTLSDGRWIAAGCYPGPDGTGTWWVAATIHDDAAGESREDHAEMEAGQRPARHDDAEGDPGDLVHTACRLHGVDPGAWDRSA